ncbi:MAG TPA: putative zinc-binding metallopeptidase, partial [Polyangiaceae bacterium]|nr:putative zinc-binding metallopeptidase [Polyangiaceae bacterium]
VLTGHASGVITLNIREADEVAREQIRQRLDERYRTLLGHFRHESGHFYWDELLRDSAELDEFRRLFGDERADYAEALAKHYAGGAPPDWQASFVSSYAASHPWEDFAETWAHYLHISDSLETASSFESIGVAAAPRDFDQLVRAWVRLSLALNSINRSMGLPDTYPFVLSGPSIEKLRFVDAVVRRAALHQPLSESVVGGLASGGAC